MANITRAKKRWRQAQYWNAKKLLCKLIKLQGEARKLDSSSYKMRKHIDIAIHEELCIITALPRSLVGEIMGYMHNQDVGIYRTTILEISQDIYRILEICEEHNV